MTKLALATLMLSHWYLLGQESGLVKAIREAQLADPVSEYVLGVSYQLGTDDVARDYGEALRWFRKAAEQGHAGAQSRLGDMYSIGRGVRQDYAEALRWYRKAAEQGDVGAEIWLGFMYLKGRGTRQDYDEAARWYLNGCRAGRC